MKTVSDRYIPHEGPEEADIFFIQDFPSSTDDTVLRILQGRGSDIFDGALDFVGLTRENVRIGSLLNYCPAANTFYKASGSWQLQESREYLEKYLATAKHKVLVPMGPRSLEFLTGHDELDKRRGSVYKYKNFLVIPIQDLSITAIDGSRKPALLHDMEKILRVAKESYAEPQFEMFVDPSAFEMEGLLEEILAAQEISVDIESKMNSHFIRCIGFAWRDSSSKLKAVCFFNDGNFQDPSAFIGPSFRRIVEKVLSSNVQKIFHNGMFDTMILEENGFSTAAYAYDTMIAQHVLQPELPIGLDYCTSIYTDMNYYKDDGKHSSDRVDRNKLGVYNCRDVIATMLVKEGQQAEFDETTRRYYEYKLKQLPLATHFSRTGMLVDPARRDEIAALLGARRDNDYRTFAAIQLHHGVEVFKVSQHAKVKEFLYDTLELPLKTGKSGNVSADEDAIVSLLATVERKIQDLKTEKAQQPWKFKLGALKLILRIRGYDKLLSSYINIDLSSDGRARSWYKFWGTETGRWSAASWYDGTGLNGQTIPREVLEG